MSQPEEGEEPQQAPAQSSAEDRVREVTWLVALLSRFLGGLQCGLRCSCSRRLATATTASSSSPTASVPLHSPSGSAPSSSSQSDPSPAPRAPEVIWAERELRARRAGYSAWEKRFGRSHTVPPTIPLPIEVRHLRNTIYVVVVSAAHCVHPADGLRPPPGTVGTFGYTHSVKTLRLYIFVEGTHRVAPEAVFHGFPSLREARLYWDRCATELPWCRLNDSP